MANKEQKKSGNREARKPKKAKAKAAASASPFAVTPAKAGGASKKK
ncbi:MAG TPA: hypothetical protein VII63_11050 [Caulobacteraceae bacterium]